jgi:hypothetical protein
VAPKTTRSLRSVRARLGEGRGGGVPVRLARASVGHKSALALMNLSHCLRPTTCTQVQLYE